jgi:hypothetical protein
MQPSLIEVESSLERGVLGISQLLVLRQKIQAPFKLHPLGFLACTLITDGSRCLRLHYWPVAGAVQQSAACQIHDHVFEFKSWVLSGAVENVEYTLSDDGTELALYRTEYVGDESILLKTTDRLKLKEASRSVFGVGTSYGVPARRLHETRRCGSTPACTVLLTNQVSADAPKVLGPLAGESRYAYHRKIVPESVIDKMFGTNP